MPRFAVLALVVVLLAAACGGEGATATPTPTPTADPSVSAAPTSPPTQPPETAFETIEAQVSVLRGLSATRPVDRAFLNGEELAARLRADFESDVPADYAAAVQRLYRGLGLLAADDDLIELYLELLASQVAGFYRPDEGKMYVLSDGGFGGVEKVFYAHEFVHALQDQVYEFFADHSAVTDQGDRDLARAALVEGDATLLMVQWAGAHLTPNEALQLLQVGLDPIQQEVLDRIPPILRDTLTFPYEKGIEFVGRIQTAGGWPAVDALFDDPPASTEQILHPDKWAAREPPIQVETPARLAERMGSDWSIGLEDTLGELQLGIWLRIGLASTDGATADRAAAGWGGDRVILLDGPDGSWAIALLTEWDSAADATEFVQQASRVRDALGVPGTVVHQPGSRTARLLLGSDSAVAIRLDGILGATGV